MKRGGDYNMTNKVKRVISALLSMLLCFSLIAPILETPVYAAGTFNREFAVHITWTEKLDLDTYVAAQDSNGELIGNEVYYSNKSENGITLNKDDTTGANSAYENETTIEGSLGGEWVGLDFPNIPSEVQKINIKVLGRGGASDLTVTLIDKATSTIVTKSFAHVEKSENAEVGYLKRNGSAWDFVNADGQVFSGTDKATTVSVNLASGLSVPDGAELKLSALYISGHTDTRTWNSTEIKSYIGKSIEYSAIEAVDADITLSWIIDGITVEIGKVQIKDRKDTSINIDSVPTCTCTITIPAINNITKDIGVDTKYELDLSTLNIKGQFKANGCFKHGSEGDKEVDATFVVSGTPSGGTASISDGKLTITDIESKATVKLKASASYLDVSDSKEFDVVVTRTVGTPKITSYSYDSETQSVKIRVDPNGNKKATVYIDGATGGTITFKKLLFKYQPADWSGEYQDSKSPNEVSNIKVVRDSSDASQALITWTDNGDKDNKIKVYVVSDTNKKSEEVEINIKDPSTTKYVYLNTDEKEIITDTNSAVIPINQIKWNSNISIKNVDDAGNESGTIVYAIPNTVIYNTLTIDDTISLNEGSSAISDAKLNDLHDGLYAIPEIVSVEVLDGGSGRADVLDGENLGELGYSGKVIQYNSADGSYGSVRLKYTYAKVRDDIPAAEGYIDITIIQRNQEPVAVNDDSTVTEGINAEDGLPFTIPTSLILANDTDRETPNTLVVTDVRKCSNGTATLNGTNITIETLSGFSGYLTFEYRISDGDLKSNNWATVTVYVKQVPKPPVAQDMKYRMQLTAKALALDLGVINPSGQEYELKTPISIFRNDDIIDSSVALANISYSYNGETGESTPYITLVIKDDTYLKEDDVLRIPYTVSNRTGSSTANIYVTMTKGEDINDMEGYLYVHRRPLAIFAPIVNKGGGNTYITDIILKSGQEFSYDLDHQKNQDPTNTLVSVPSYTIKGVRTWEWGVRLLDGAWKTKTFDADSYSGSAARARQAGLDWIHTQTNSLIKANYQKSVMISLRVRDVDGPDNIGEWSEARTLLLSSIEMPPVAMFVLDKSTYTVPNIMRDFNIKITDLSYDSNGDKIKTWRWTLETPSGSKPINDQAFSSFNQDNLGKQVSEAIYKAVYTGNYSPEDPTFKLSLVVVEDTPSRLESDMYSVSFKVYKQNYPPEFNDKPGADTATIASSTLYEIDDGADGFVGDNWGTANNTTHKGKINFEGLFTITDDQSLSNIKLNWLFDGQKITKRSLFNDDASSYVTKSYSNKKYYKFESPFTGTVTSEGFKPGAYKLTVTAMDNPTGNAYPPNSAQISSWRTYATKKPYHFYVVPKLDMFMHNEFNGWIDQTYRESDGATLDEAGLKLEDIVPTIGDTFRLFGTTNQYVTSLWGYEDYNNNGKWDSTEKKFIFKRIATNLDGTREWESSFTIEDIDDAPEGKDFTDLRLKFVGETTWGSETEVTTRTKQIPMVIKVLPVKLFDFRVTELTDPDISDTFNSYVNGLVLQGLKLSNGNAVDGVPVGKLAVDRNTTKGASGKGNIIRKGYSFYFSIGSKGLTKDTDEVRISPKFYESAVNAAGVITIGNELAGYVPDETGVYQPYTTGAISDKINKLYELFYEGSRLNSLNTHADVRIPISLRTMKGSEQTWYGRYGIPADAKFFRLGTTVTSANEYTGDVLVTFEIKAYKKGKARYNYVERGQWLKERQAIPDALKVIYATKEADWKANNNYIGTIIVYNGAKSVRDDYISNPVWKE